MSLTPEQRLALIVFNKYECEICRRNGLKIKYPPQELEIHKINPEQGYENHRNLMVLCKKHHDILSSSKRIAIGVQS